MFIFSLNSWDDISKNILIIVFDVEKFSILGPANFLISD